MESYENASTNHESFNKDVSGLIERKIIKFAEQPENNPDNLNFNKYTLPIVGHDYPAKTPVMWNAVYEKFGMNVGNIMVVGKAAKSPEILNALRSDVKYIGGGVGVGFKDKIIKYLDEVEPVAEQIGSVNLILKIGEKLKGFNTDGVGYVESLKRKFKDNGFSIKDKKILILGSGGTANSIAFALVGSGSNVTILNRTIGKAEELSKKLNKYFNKNGLNDVKFGGEGAILDSVVDADVVLNVSTKGAAGDFEDYSSLAQIQLPIGESSKKINLEESEEVFKKISKDTIISDIVLGVSSTPMLKRACELGFDTLDGVPMVVNQGVEAFWLIHNAELEKRGITKDQIAETMREAASL